MNQTERDKSLYCTPPHVVSALLRRETFPGVVWECAAGRGDIVRVLRRCGCEQVVATDLNDWGFRPCGIEDFLQSRREVESLVTNPPYPLKHEFLVHAKKIVRCKIAMLLPVLFEYTAKFIDNHEHDTTFAWKALYAFRQPIPWKNVKERSGKVIHGWFVFQRGYQGPVVRDKIKFGPNPEFLARTNFATVAQEDQR
jgi:hypothetical protein